MDTIAQALFLVVIIERLVDAGITPIWEKFGLDKFWLKYVAWVLGGLLIGFSGINLLTTIPNLDPLLGRILSAVIAGGGSNLLHDLFDKKPQP